MILFIDTINSPGRVILFTQNKEEIDRIEWNSIQNEASTLIPNIDDLLKNNDKKYEDILNIVVVNGPGSFTGVRTTSIIANALSYIKGTLMTEINFFELFEKSHKKYPIIKKSSRRDHFVKKSESSEIEIISNSDLEKYLEENNIDKAYGEVNFEPKIAIISEIDYNKVIKEIILEEKSVITPLYIKKPNIS